MLALAVSTGFAVLVLRGVVGRDAPHASPTSTLASIDRSPSPTVTAGRLPASDGRGEAEDRGHRVAGQDRQDRPGTEAHRRARRESVRHRALQHVPWRWGGVSVELVGAKDGKAVLVIEGPSIAAARREWSRFLHRYRDDGRSYLPRFRAGRGGER
jgi:hypothetical protein